MKEKSSHYGVYIAAFVAYLVIGVIVLIYGFSAKEHEDAEQAKQLILDSIPYETVHGTVIDAFSDESGVVLVIEVNESLKESFDNVDLLTTFIAKDVFDGICMNYNSKAIVEQGYFGMIFLSTKVHSLMMITGCNDLNDVYITVKHIKSEHFMQT